MRPLAVWLLGALLGCRPPEADARPFTIGVNYPWQTYGLDFGTSTWGHYGVSAYPHGVEDDFAMLSASGVEAVRWFALTDGRAAIRFDAAGIPTGLDDVVLDDFDVALDIAAASNIQVVWVLLDFYWCAPSETLDGAVMGGRASVIANPRARAALLEEIVRPLLERYGDHPNVLAWEIINEPEWAIEAGWVSLAQMTDFIDQTNALIQDTATQPSTVGSATMGWMGALWADRGLGWLQFHDYTDDGDYPPASLFSAQPVLIGEFPTMDGSTTARLDAAYLRGYMGAWGWSLNAEDTASRLDLGALERWSPP